MRLPALFAAFAVAATLPGAAWAQTPPPAVAPANGVTVVETRSWLTGLGGSVGEPTVSEGVSSLHIADQPLPWNLTFYGCATGPCGDVQFSAVFTGAITADQINAWNRENRFLKAFFIPATAGGEATAVVQYDVVLTNTGTEQLRDPTYIWLQMLRTFAQGLAAAAETPAAQ